MESVISGYDGICRHVVDVDKLTPATVWVFAFLCAQLAWRGFVVIVRPKLPMPRTWIADLIVSFALFGAAIYIPWWTR